MDTNQQDLIHLRPQNSDEIDLGELLRKLIGEWKLVTAVTLLGAVASVVIALQQTSIYRVEAILAAPSIAELGTMVDQSLLPINSEKAIEQVAEGLYSVKNQRLVFNQSELSKVHSEEITTINNDLFRAVSENLSIERIEREFYTLPEDQKSPFKEVRISLESPHVVEAADYVNTLAMQAMNTALGAFSENTAARKNDQISSLKRDIKALKAGTEQARLANITRLEEANELTRTELLLELTLLEQQAKANRLKRIAQLNEAIMTASGLKIVEPVSWENLRPTANNAQFLNSVKNVAEPLPLYFQGTRLLMAERDMLHARMDDLLYVANSAALQLQLDKLAADPVIAALKLRSDDTIYVEGYDALLKKLAGLENLSTLFPGLRMATLIQPAIASTQPIKPNRKLIAVVGTVLAGFLGLFFALIRIAIKK